MTDADKLVVLVVDDERSLLSTFVRNFRSLFAVHVASSGAEALAMIDSDPPDLLISDFAMPGMNGLELLERVAAARPSLVRMLSTAHSLAPEVLEAKQRGLFAELVEKPWTRATVLAAVERACPAASR